MKIKEIVINEPVTICDLKLDGREIFFRSYVLFYLSRSRLLVSQNAIPSKKHLGGYLPYAFTEQGVANLSSVLNNDKAIEINIQIIRAFVTMRKFIIANVEVFHRLDRVERKQFEYDKNFEQIFDAIQSKELKPKQGIFFNGEVFDAYKFVSDLIRSAKESIFILDN